MGTSQAFMKKYRISAKKKTCFIFRQLPSSNFQTVFHLQVEHMTTCGHQTGQIEAQETARLSAIDRYEKSRVQHAVGYANCKT